MADLTNYNSRGSARAWMGRVDFLKSYVSLGLSGPSNNGLIRTTKIGIGDDISIVSDQELLESDSDANNVSDKCKKIYENVKMFKIEHHMSVIPMMNNLLESDSQTNHITDLKDKKIDGGVRTSKIENGTLGISEKKLSEIDRDTNDISGVSAMQKLLQAEYLPEQIKDVTVSKIENEITYVSNMQILLERDRDTKYIPEQVKNIYENSFSEILKRRDTVKTYFGVVGTLINGLIRKQSFTQALLNVKMFKIDNDICGVSKMQRILESDKNTHYVPDKDKRFYGESLSELSKRRDVVKKYLKEAFQSSNQAMSKIFAVEANNILTDLEDLRPYMKDACCKVAKGWMKDLEASAPKESEPNFELL